MKSNRFIGKLCFKCGGVERYKIHGSCCACAKARDSARAKANPAKHNARSMAWRMAHPVESRAIMARSLAKHPDTGRNWAKANPDKVLARSRTWRAKHPDKVRELNARWSAKHPGRKNELTRAWQAAHPDEPKALVAKHVARLKGASIGCRKEYATFLKWVRTAPMIPCFYCKRDTSPKERHRDHYIPLTRGGADSVENLRVACASCNHRKHALMPDEFMKRLA